MLDEGIIVKNILAGHFPLHMGHLRCTTQMISLTPTIVHVSVTFNHMINWQAQFRHQGDEGTEPSSYPREITTAIFKAD